MATRLWGMRTTIRAGIVICAMVVWAVLGYAAAKPEKTPSKPPAPQSVQMGNFFALLVGIDDYAHWPDLSTPVRDTEALRKVLIDRYGFSPNRIMTLTNQDATRENILGALYSLTSEESPVTENDNVLIYYAGHGELTNVGGYWVPVEAALERERVGAYISHSEIRDYIAAMKAKHVYLVVDSCFSGSLLASATRSKPPVLTERYFQEAYQRISRTGLTAGGKEKVNDVGPDGRHSVFAFYFLKALRENKKPFLAASSLFEEIKVPIANNSRQTPISMPIRDARDEGGEFIFALTTRAPSPIPPPALPPATPEAPPESFVERGPGPEQPTAPPGLAEELLAEREPAPPLLPSREEATSDTGFTLDSVKKLLKKLGESGKDPLPPPPPSF